MKTKIFTSVLMLVVLGIFAGESYACGNQSPVAVLTAEPNYADVNETVTLDGNDSYDPDGYPSGGITRYEWDFTNNGSYDYYETASYHPDGTFDGNTTHEYNEPNIYTVKLRVSDGYSTDTETCTVYVTETYYVKTDGDDDANGLSWATAFATIQKGIDESDLYYIEIWVAAGTYKPTSDNNRAIFFELVDGVGVYGGFAGTETARGQRDWRTNITTLSGDINIQNDANDNSYHVVVGADNATLDGFTITGGKANGGSGNSDGAGIYNPDGASTTVKNCVLVDNHASSEGGGIYNLCQNPTAVNCVFYNNSAAGGGGMWTYVDEGFTVQITNCVFIKNSASGGGAMMMVGGWEVPEIANCTFYDNNGIFGSAIFSQICTTKVTNCVMWNNRNYVIDGWDGGGSNVSYCDIEGCGGSGDGWDENLGYDGGGNIDDDPCFADPCNPDGNDNIFATFDDGLQLRYDAAEESPCVDAGDNTAADIDTDIKGVTRIINGDDTPGAVVDMGAYEFPGIGVSVGNVRFYQSASYDDNGGAGLNNCQVHFGDKSGGGSYGPRGLYIEVDATGGQAGTVDSTYLLVTSESDSTGITALFEETGAATNKYRTIAPIYLAEASSQATLELKVLDEETVYVGGVAGAKVDRGEIAAICSYAFDDPTDQAMGVFATYMMHDLLYDDYGWFSNGKVEIESDNGEVEILQPFILNVGNGSSEGDLLFEASHGGFANGWLEEAEIAKPGDSYPDWEVINSDDWDEDAEWVVLHSCEVLGFALPPPPWPQDAFVDEWDDALLRLSTQNNCHGILASSDVLLLGTTANPVMINHITGFCEMLRTDETVVEAYMDSALDPSVEQYGASALFHYDNLADTLSDVTADTTDTTMYYTWYNYSTDQRDSETYEATLGGGPDLPEGPAISELETIEIKGGRAIIACEIPTEQPKLTEVKVGKESLRIQDLDYSGFDEPEFDNKGRVKFKKPSQPGKQDSRVGLTLKQSGQKAEGFIKEKGGRLPADAKLSVKLDQMVRIFDSKDPKTTIDQYVKKRVMEYRHQFNNIEIAGGRRGDMIRVEMETDEVIGFERHWREIIGPVGAEKRVISARQALEVALKNLPKSITSAHEYIISSAELFYYGLPSEQEQQYLIPAWGIQVGGSTWLYVNAFTGEFLK